MAEATMLQVLSPSGDVQSDLLPELSEERMVDLYRQMLRTRAIDTRMLALQRQGRIGFYGTCRGQEAATIGSGAAMLPEDWVYPALREGAVLLLRGYSLEQYMGQLVGCALDPTHGRQMPCHFGSDAHNYVTLSSVIGTQINQAMGTAWAMKIKKHKKVTLGYMGDGATSSTDFHCALTIAAVHKVPAVFFCQNNQWAISVPFSKQTASKGIAAKAVAYGMPGVAVDGNDVLAVYRATKEAADRARNGGGPTLIEAITYRQEGHSSSDDPTRYRDAKIHEEWMQRDPLDRYRRFLELEGLVSAEMDAEIEAEVKASVNAAILAAEASPMPDVNTLFTDVYAEMPEQLLEQREDVLQERNEGTADGAFPL
ncbi:MAG: 3-methyl-2-oxobutanoate dehydrogenase [Planctomycetota bacterium]|nr:MAG: 3-methyl-2-oxobutanoate dehydrogenase [Planctomycetota bacterium]